MSGVPSAVVTGNSFDKYHTKNPLARRLVSGFLADLDSLYMACGARSVIDVGCGEAELTKRFSQRLHGGRCVGVDLDDAKLRTCWRGVVEPVEFCVADACDLPFADREFDLACGVEVLEHLQDPYAGLCEMARVASRYLLVSVPREPVWRILNVARGAYIKSLGNTPGHLNHWSKRSFLKFVSSLGSIQAIRLPVPWVMALVELF
jgi:SAM-dependent methyltransferase